MLWHPLPALFSRKHGDRCVQEANKLQQGKQREEEMPVWVSTLQDSPSCGVKPWHKSQWRVGPDIANYNCLLPDRWAALTDQVTKSRCSPFSHLCPASSVLLSLVSSSRKYLKYLVKDKIRLNTTNQYYKFAYSIQVTHDCCYLSLAVGVFSLPVSILIIVMACLSKSVI